jgi:hypothetical protein
MSSRLYRSVFIVAVVGMVTAVVLGCGIADDLKGAVDATLKKPPATQTGTGAAPEPAATPADPTADTNGDIKLAWVAESGSARQDPIGLLDATPLLKDGDHLRARRTTTFKPNSPKAQSAEGRYVYTIDLVKTADGVTYKGTMTIDWTMTIVWSAESKNVFHSVYTADVSASYDSGNGRLSDGVAKGTAKTTDTFIAGKTSMPRNTSAPFTWVFDGV